MTLIVNHPNPNNAPRTHAMVIGIGAYKHLPKGADPKPTTHIPRLGQLTSPPVSARAFTDWLCENLNNPEAPLGSVELLLSEANPNPTYTVQNQAPQIIEEATDRNIFTACDSWMQRLNSNPDNVAIFYYCGHGLEKANLILLPSNFNEISTAPWRTAIDFNQSLVGMRQIRAKTQCYFIDSCRESSKQLLADFSVAGTPLFPALAEAQDVDRLTQPVLFAASSGRKAFGKPNSVTFFTQALLAALSGKSGSQLSNGRWGIDTDSLSSAVVQLVKADNQKRKREQHQSVKRGGEFGEARMIHQLPATPSVDVTVFCKPLDITDRAKLSLKNLNTAILKERLPEAGPWQVTIEAGFYDIQASFADNQLRGEPLRRILLPPMRDAEIEVQ